MKNLNHKIPFQGQMKFMNNIFLVRDSQCTWTLKILSKLTLIIPDIQRLLDNFSFFSERFIYIFLFVNNIPDYCNQNQIHICTKVMKIKFTHIHSHWTDIAFSSSTQWENRNLKQEENLAYNLTEISKSIICENARFKHVQGSWIRYPLLCLVRPEYIGIQ